MRGLDFRRALFGEGQLELVEQELEVFLGLGVAGHDDLAAVGGGQVDVEHLHGGELFEHGARGQPAGGAFEPGLEGHLQAVGEEGYEDVGMDAAFELVVDGAQGQVAFEFFEGLFDFGELEVKLPRCARPAGSLRLAISLRSVPTVWRGRFR